MRILLTNDDGIHADGLAVLECIAARFSDDVWVVAPESDQSGVAHSLSLSDPLRLRKIGPKRFAVKGTPTDCVLMAVKHLIKDKPVDLLLSGVNRGQNVAEDVTYSGTIAAAIEGALLGIPALALSQSYAPGVAEGALWAATEAHAPKVIAKLIEVGVPKGGLVNVNFPSCAAAEVAGLAVTAQGQRSADLIGVEQRRDGRGHSYFWLVFQRPGFAPPAGSDLEALAARKISVTPLKLDLTDEAVRARYAEAFGAF